MKTDSPLVSIIIPTYNRAHLISKTLDSVLAQTYKNWECIIVDDESTDDTLGILEKYCNEDKRFKNFVRPAHYLKGGNDARNYGFEVSKGAFINWFDSDDLMKASFISDKLNCFLTNDVDFVVSRCENFFENGTVKPFSIGENLTKPLNVDNLINRSVFWVTGDLMIKREKLEGVKFDPEVKSSQEYNFFVKLLAHNKPKGVFLNKILYSRRVHLQSIQGGLKTKIKNRNKHTCYYNLYFSVHKLVNKKSRNCLLDIIMATTFMNYVHNKKSKNTFKVLSYVLAEKGILNTFIFICSLIIAFLIGKGYNIMLVSRR